MVLCQGLRGEQQLSCPHLSPSTSADANIRTLGFLRVNIASAELQLIAKVIPPKGSNCGGRF